MNYNMWQKQLSEMYNYVLHILTSLNNFVNKTFQNKHIQNILVLQDQQTTHSYKRHININKYCNK